MMTEAHKRDLIIVAIVFIVLASGAIVGLSLWSEQHDARLKAESNAEVKDQLIKDLQQKDAQRDQQIKDLSQANDHIQAQLEAVRLNQKLSPADVAKEVSKYLPSVPVVLTPGQTTVQLPNEKAPTEVIVPALPSGIIALKQTEWQDFTVRCAECNASLASMSQQVTLKDANNESLKQQLEASQDETKKWKIAAKGGPFWTRVGNDLKRAAGAGIGAGIGGAACASKPGGTVAVCAGVGALAGWVVAHL